MKQSFSTSTEEDPQKQAKAIEQLVNIGASGIKISLLPVNKENVDDLSKRWTGWLQGRSN